MTETIIYMEFISKEMLIPVERRTRRRRTNRENINTNAHTHLNLVKPSVFSYISSKEKYKINKFLTKHINRSSNKNKIPKKYNQIIREIIENYL